MIAFVRIAGVTGVGMWFLWFVVFAATRERVPAARRVPYARTRSSTDSVAGLADNAAGPWTALDDYQLAGLLEGPS